MKLPDIYTLCRQVIADPQNERFVQLFKDGKTGPLIGAAVKKAEGAKPAAISEVLAALIANPDAQPDADWEKKEQDEREKRFAAGLLEQHAREHFNRGAIFAYEQVAHILETDREVRRSHNWPMGEMYDTIWSNIAIHVYPAIKAHKK
jgi:hypothetical protein